MQSTWVSLLEVSTCDEVISLESALYFNYTEEAFIIWLPVLMKDYP